MSNSKKAFFFSSDLNDTFEKYGDVLIGFNTARDQLSTDIKALEKKLQDAALEVSFSYSLGKNFISRDGDEAAVAFGLQESGSASGLISEDFIRWDKDSNGKFRLLFEESLWEGGIDIDTPSGPFFPEGDPVKSEARPLIETKLEIRMKAYKHLSYFVKAFAEHVSLPGARTILEEEPF
jgi:hypothetical protein